MIYKETEATAIFRRRPLTRTKIDSVVYFDIKYDLIQN